jgi:hypothetical protein
VETNTETHIYQDEFEQAREATGTCFKHLIGMLMLLGEPNLAHRVGMLREEAGFHEVIDWEEETKKYAE